MKPLQISAETAQKLAKQLNIPLEHLMHMPKHILLQKLSELANSDGPAKKSTSNASEDEASNVSKSGESKDIDSEKS